MRSNIEDVRISGSTIASKLKLGVLSKSLGANYTMLSDSPPIHILIPTAARNVTLPALENGLTFIIQNASAGNYDLTIKNPAGDTVGTISQNEGAIAFSDGTSWYVTMVGTST